MRRFFLPVVSVGLLLISVARGQETYSRIPLSALQMTEGAVKVAAHRLRHRYREVLREQIAQTVETAADVDDELRDLQNALST